MRKFPKSNSRCHWLAILGCLVFLFGCQSNVDYSDIPVQKIYDGDTIRVANGERVRFIGVDCDEIHDNDKLLWDVKRTGIPAETLKASGRKAFAFTRNLLAGRSVRLTFDIERRDKYGRLLAYVWVRARGSDFNRPEYYITDVHIDGEGNVPYVFVNASLAKAGMARPMNIRPDTTFAGLFQSLYEEARSSGHLVVIP